MDAFVTIFFLALTVCVVATLAPMAIDTIRNAFRR